MNCEQANKIGIDGFLSSIGIQPKKRTRKGFMYCSPFRNEKEASFIVFQADNHWYDYGTGENGSLIDLVCKIYNATTSGALSILSGTHIPANPFSFEKQETSDSSIQIKHVQKLQNRALIQYLANRCIPFDIASIYLEEVYYTAYEGQATQYFAIAFRNDKAGYELRNGFKSKSFPKGFKGSTNPKYITEIPGNESIIDLFEGFFDYLSFLVYFQKSRPDNTAIILNSTSNIRKIESKLSQAKKIYSYLDNDKTGKETLTWLKGINPNVENKSEQLYPDHKDFNDCLISIKQQSPGTNC